MRLWIGQVPGVPLEWGGGTPGDSLNSFVFMEALSGKWFFISWNFAVPKVEIFVKGHLQDYKHSRHIAPIITLIICPLYHASTPNQQQARITLLITTNHDPRLQTVLVFSHLKTTKHAHSPAGSVDNSLKKHGSQSSPTSHELYRTNGTRHVLPAWPLATIPRTMLEQLAEPFHNAKLTPHHNQAPGLRLGYILSSVSPSKPRQIGSKAVRTILNRVTIPPPQTRDRFIRNFRGVFQASTKSYDQKRRSTSRRNEICLLSDNDSELLLGLVDQRALL